MNVFCCFVFRPFQQTLTQLLLLLFGMGAHVNLLYLAWMRLLFLLALLSILCCFYCCFLLALFVSSELFTLIVEAEFCNQLLCPAPVIRMPHEQAPTCRFPFRCAAHILQKLTPVATSLTIPAKVALTPIHITCIASSQFCVSLFLFFFYQTPNTILLLPYCRIAVLPFGFCSQLVDAWPFYCELMQIWREYLRDWLECFDCKRKCCDKMGGIRNEK